MLSNADIAILHAVSLQKKFDGQALAAVDLEIIPREQVRPVRPVIHEHEIMMASGGCTIQVWDAPGDGTFNAAGAPIVATGFGNNTGTAQMVGMAAGTLAVNMFASSRARKNAEPRWMDYIPSGALTVSSHGLYVEDVNQGILTWDWNLIQSIEWHGPSCVVFLIPTSEGTVRAALTSDWAELAYVTWINFTFPRHPQKYLYTTADWAERVRAGLGWDPWTGEQVQAALPG